ncbi:ABC transporter permease [Alkalicoccobacillus porphyridii]|uniref:ABC transporter permease n=1 Tax=Alkalicoccobacillus porphyridii TaxID=2597270 RepID=A0A553ZXN8_9BACI|nr:ABC transporter permease [Alkalicoccobacillus porphyridii]TSB46221.1 ABC transporter permease [Alkalicoccobacillus porphyridii]
MRQLVISELERLWQMKMVKILLLLFIGISIFSAYFLTWFDLGIYTIDSETPLNTVNFPWFLLREVSFFVLLVIMPLLCIIVLNSPVKSKAYYLILSRPFSRLEFLLSKWGTLLLAAIFITIFIFIIGLVSGSLFYQIPEYVTFYNDQTRFSVIEGYMYSFKLYFSFLGIIITVIALSSVLAILAPNPIITYFLLMISYVIPIYFSSELSFFLLPIQSIFISLSESGFPLLYMVLPLIAAVGGGISSLLWLKQDFK